MVEKLINDETINIRGFPDYIERHIYRNMIKILLGLAKKTLETSSVHFLGHQIDNLRLRPIMTTSPQQAQPEQL